MGSLVRLRETDPVKYKVKRPWTDPLPPQRLPSGLTVIHLGKKSFECESGVHKWFTEIIMGIPLLVCLRCGFRSPKPVLEKTATRRELIETAQKAMNKTKPKLLDMDATIDEQAKAKEKFYVDIFERVQREYKRDSTGKLIRKSSSK